VNISFYDLSSAGSCPLVFAITFTRRPTASSAHALGDDTAWSSARGSWPNPLRHIDPFER